MERIFESAIGKVIFSDPEVYVDNQARKRSGHMSHAMVEYAPGKIMAFNSNCPQERFAGHSPFGWIEYRCSTDYGKTWGEIKTLECSMDVLLRGVNTYSVEKAVCCNGIITAFCLRNTQFTELAHDPVDTCVCVQSSDFGETWSEPVEFSKYPGRIYDACVRDGVIYVLQMCCPVFVSEKHEDYKLFASYDNGATFQEVSTVGIDSCGHVYGALQFTADGKLRAYANEHDDACNMAVCESDDLGRTWRKLPDIRLSSGLRNLQMSRLGNGYIMHGRARLGLPWGKGFVFYTSKDGINWDDGILLDTEKTSCYYSNNLLITMPDGKEKLLVQYSDLYPCEYACSVNVMHLFAEIAEGGYNEDK